MAMKLAKILGPDDSEIYIQYDEEEESDELRAVSVSDNIIEKTNRFKAMMVSTVRGYAEVVLQSVQQSMTDLLAPEKVILEFGLQLGGETGVPFVTKGTAQANVKVTVEWLLSRGGKDNNG